MYLTIKIILSWTVVYHGYELPDIIQGVVNKTVFLFNVEHFGKGSCIRLHFALGGLKDTVYFHFLEPLKWLEFALQCRYSTVCFVLRLGHPCTCSKLHSIL